MTGPAEALNDTQQEPQKNPIMAENRIGIFQVSRDLLFWSDPEKLRAFMANFIIVRAEYMVAYDGIEYTAFSALFEPSLPCAKPPFYDISVFSDGEMSVKKSMFYAVDGNELST